MDLSTICQEISYIANDTTLASGGANYSRCKAWVRESYYLDILATRNDWWFLRKTETVDTVASTNRISLPSGVDIKEVREIRILGYKPIEGISESQADELGGYTDITEEGRPTKFWHYDRSSGVDRLQLYPVPDSVYTLQIRCMATPDTLTDDSDTPSLPDEFHYLLVKGGYCKALKHNQDPGYQQEFAEYLGSIKRLQNRNARDDYRTDSWWRV